MTRTHGETARLHRYLADRDTSDQYNTHRLALDEEPPTGRNTMTTEITIKRVGGIGNDGYWQASDGAWSPDNGGNWFDSFGFPVLVARRSDYRTLVKNHLDSLATEAEPERATFTGCPIKDKWGDGVYESALTLVSVTHGEIIWYGKNSERVRVFDSVDLNDGVYTKLSDDPAAIINPDLLGGG